MMMLHRSGALRFGSTCREPPRNPEPQAVRTYPRDAGSGFKIPMPSPHPPGQVKSL